MTETTLDDLHRQIMNLQDFPPWLMRNNADPTDAELDYYTKGHRDARHAAAELVAAFSASVSDVENEMTETEIENVCDALKNALNDLLENGANVEDYDRVCEHSKQIDRIADEIMGEE